MYITVPRVPWLAATMSAAQLVWMFLYTVEYWSAVQAEAAQYVVMAVWSLPVS